ncbi:Programmed cell death protein 2 [Bienertia sinuspersici]
MASKSTFKAESPESCENGCLTYLNRSCVIPQGDEFDSDTTFDDDSVTDTDDDSTCVGIDDNNSGNEGSLWLGFVRKPKKKSSLLRHSFPDKAGGTPAWLDPLHLPTGKSFLCDFCEAPLQFVLQVNAPIIGSEFAHYRTIFVFMCLSMACLNKDQGEQKMKAREAAWRSVKVFRCQLPMKNPFYKCKDDRNNGCSNHIHLEAPLCSWCGTWKGQKLCTGCRRVRYCSKTHQQIYHWQSHKADCKRMSNSDMHNGDSASAKSERERLECKETSDSLTSMKGKDEHMNSILESFNGDDKKKSLASFQKHLHKDHAQVLRCWLSDGEPLWPELSGRPSSIDIPNCKYCNGPMRFEFQIMPQLLYYLRVEREDDPFEKSLDWATIAVYTCEASCDSAVTYKEEFPWVQLYEQVSNWSK